MSNIVNVHISWVEGDNGGSLYSPKLARRSTQSKAVDDVARAENNDAMRRSACYVWEDPT